MNKVKTINIFKKTKFYNNNKNNKQNSKIMILEQKSPLIHLKVEPFIQGNGKKICEMVLENRYGLMVQNMLVYKIFKEKKIFYIYMKYFFLNKCKKKSK